MLSVILFFFLHCKASRQFEKSHFTSQWAVRCFPSDPMGSTFSLPQMLFSISRYFSPSFKGLLCEMSPATLSLISVFPSLYPWLGLIWPLIEHQGSGLCCSKGSPQPWEECPAWKSCSLNYIGFTEIAQHCRAKKGWRHMPTHLSMC